MLVETWANSVKEAAQRNIGAQRTVDGRSRRVDSSGELRESLDFFVEEIDQGLRIGFVSDLEYAIYVEHGVSGNDVKYDTPFEYTDKTPPIEDILGYIKTKPIRVRDLKTGKFVKSTDKAKLSAAIAIAKYVKKNGISPKKFYTEAFEEKKDELPEALRGRVEILVNDRLERFRK